MKNSAQLISSLHQYLKGSTLVPPSANTLKRFSNHSVTPLATLMCENYGDIQTAIKFCSNNDIEFVVKSGGRNQANPSIRPNALILDLSPLKGIHHSLEADQMKIKVQAGVNFRQLQNYLNGVNMRNRVGYAVPYAWDRNISCIGAHTVMGNSLVHRTCGMGVDLIQEATVLLSNGQIVTANRQSNNDLLWAVKGCGIGMGVILDITEHLPESTCNILDPSAGKQVRIRSYSFPINNQTSTLGQDLSKTFNSIQDNVLPYTIFIMNPKFSATYLITYELLYDKIQKKIVQQKNETVDKLMHDMVSKYDGKKYYQTETILESVANTGFKQSQKQQYYFIWGGYTNIDKIPQLWQEMTSFCTNNPINKLKDKQATLCTFIVPIQSEIFRKRNINEACLPVTGKDNVIIYGNVAFKDKQNEEECYNYVKRFQAFLRNYMSVGSVCDFNLKDLQKEPHLGKWILGHNYEQLKSIHQKYDPINKFSKGLFE